MTIIALLAALTSGSPPVAVQRADTVERGRFAIYNLQQRVGFETFSIVIQNDTTIVAANWAFRYLGSPVSLESELRTSRAGAPLSLRIKGQTSTWTTTDHDLVVGARRGFPLTHYSPIALEQMLFRHWLRTGRPSTIPLIPAGVATFTKTGVDTIRVDGRTERLDRYAVTGVIWGRQSLWVDSAQRVIAATGGNAELDRSEYVREGYESALPTFVAGGVRDGMAAIEAISRSVRPIQQGAFAIVGARIIDATGKAPIENGAVLVRDGRIAAVGPRAGVTIPSGVPLIDATGKTVLPGLWDMHVHYEQVEWPLVSLAAGVTTARDVANEFELIVALRAAQKAGRILSPTILSAGVIDGGRDPLGVNTANSPDEARARVRRYHDAGFEQIKIYQSVPPDLVSVIADEAHKYGMTVTGHVPSGMTARQFIEAGADQINHQNFVTSLLRAPGGGRGPLDLESDAAKAGIRFLVDHGTVIDPSFARGEEGGHIRGRYDEVEPGVRRVPLELREGLQSTGMDSATYVRTRPPGNRPAPVAKTLRDAGVPIVLGTDLTVPGFSIYRELELAVQGGFTPLEAIQAATLVPARAMKLDRSSGTIEAGKRADLIIVAGNPLERIEEIRRVETVVIGGKAYRSRDLWALAGFDPR